MRDFRYHVGLRGSRSRKPMLSQHRNPPDSDGRCMRPATGRGGGFRIQNNTMRTHPMPFRPDGRARRLA
ncbi:hypothetical protein NUV26_27005 [Burkholderia pseudomultivorans]|uniref:hypothetical protein n=1 Tax=Burkholderia pseudomultivorans TaxID=1207504 RepID=UPI000753866E|nr:hypothetical protein [Burkholderia pseudomultivorans]AOI93047.1 hypothetical protein WS57_30920 [Burkholderia pseudomultivorans]KVC32032.1 hypothetical protein WS55_00225 [Burkholderia pseudomultivorans]KVC34973.1 hypothetical protein WS56_09790 [Burkholderia pseudomultivorans]MDS0795826.1 hypothetical protein [Burkholderia pseudomultivorans]MDS0859739.1 hypothetical protein [Burkholderia pseudomultivorans]